MKERRKTSIAQKLILFMVIVMMTINSTTMYFVKNLMEKTLIETEHKYLSEIVKNIRNTAEMTVFEFISICDVLSHNSAFIELLKDSDQNNPMADHHNASIVIEEMSNIMDSYGEKIMSMAVFDIEQDSYLLNTGGVSGDDFSFKERPYYSPVLTGQYIVTPPYLDVLTKGLVVTIAHPVTDYDGTMLGVVGLDLPINFMSHLVVESSYGDSGRSLVLDENYKIIAYADPTYIGEDYNSLNLIGVEIEQELLHPTGNLVQYEMNDSARLGMVDEIESLDWTVLTAMDYSEFDQISSILLALMAISFIFSLLLCSGLISGKLSKELTQMNFNDSLTGFLNRAGFSNKIDQISDHDSSLGVISINVNGLKNINEVSGNKVGDEHIKNCSNTLKEHFQYEFFRMSGDEFIGLALDVSNDEFESKINSLHASMKGANNYDFSFGHAWGKSNELWKLQQEAETFMYINKQEYYSSTKRKSEHVDNIILAELLSFLANGEFMIYLQPQVHLHDHSLYGAEALIRRFDKKNQKMVFPDQFIPLYEKNSIIRHVDMFVVEEVCKLLNDWNKSSKAIPVSVNLSRVTLQEYGIVDSITKICDQYNVPHNLLVIEVTERVGLVENNVASSLIQQFKDNGFHISLDDFGCAYSNIVTLAQIEVDEVKIDKSLVDDLTTSKKNQVLVKNVLSMCNELENTSTLAEGIECIEQADLLNKLGCVLGQGYYFSRPISTTDFISNYIEI